jgi:hypothetical protein
MPKPNDYSYIIVESFLPTNTSGLHGLIHIRPAPNQIYPQNLFVECSNDLINNYPVGTRFRIKVKLTNKEGGRDFLYSYYGWSHEVIT